LTVPSFAQSHVQLPKERAPFHVQCVTEYRFSLLPPSGTRIDGSETLLVSSASQFFPLYFIMLGGLSATRSVSLERTQ